MWAGMQLGHGLLPPAWPWERRESAVNRARRVGSRGQRRLRRSERHTSNDLPKYRTNIMNFGPSMIVRVMVDRPAANIAPCATCVKRTCMVAPSLAALVRIRPIGPDGTSRAIGRRHLPSNGHECVLCGSYLLCVVHRPCRCPRLPCSSRELTAVTYGISTPSQQRTVRRPRKRCAAPSRSGSAVGPKSVAPQASIVRFVQGVLAPCTCTIRPETSPDC